MHSTVSIVVPTFQRAALLSRALNSIATQTFGDWEAIIVDDGSTDGTDLLVKKFAEKFGRTRYVYQSNQGASAARNCGIDLARGEFVAFLDSDDEFTPNKLARQISLFERVPTLGLVFSDYSYIDLGGRHQQSALKDFFPIVHQVPREEVGINTYTFPMGIKDWLSHSYFVATIVGIVRRDVLADFIRFSASQKYAEEWLFYCQVCERCQAGFVDEPLAIHHFTPGSVTRNGQSNLAGQLRSLQAMKNCIHGLSHQQRKQLQGKVRGLVRELERANVRSSDGLGLASRIDGFVERNFGNRMFAAIAEQMRSPIAIDSV